MISVEQWHTIRCLAQRGYSRRKIAAELGISRNTVDTALARETPPGYQRAAPVTGESVHDDFIRGGLSRGLCGSRILKELRAQRRYEGSQASFYRRLGQLKAEQAAPPATLRFETEPGQQAQFDWTEYRVSLGGALTHVYVFGMVLGYSRRCHWFPSLSTKQPAVLEAVEAGWRHFGGACRELVVDNARTLVTKHTRTELIWHPRFLHLCGHYCVQPIAGTPRHPQGKGKVENPFRLLEAHFIQGNRWSGFAAFQQELTAHEAQWEQRTHGTTGEVPIARFTREQPLLLPLPPRPYFGVREEARQVSRDCLVSYGGVRYSVPAPYAGKQVWVRSSQGQSVEIVAPSGETLARHALPPPGTRLVVNQEHFALLRRRHQAGLQTLAARFRQRYDAWELAERFLQRFIGQATHHPERQLARLLELLQGVPDPVALDVLRDGLEYNLLTRDFLESRVQHHMRGRADAAAPSAPSPQLQLPDLAVERSLSQYDTALPAS